MDSTQRHGVLDGCPVAENRLVGLPERIAGGVGRGQGTAEEDGGFQEALSDDGRGWGTGFLDGILEPAPGFVHPMGRSTPARSAERRVRGIDSESVDGGALEGLEVAVERIELSGTGGIPGELQDGGSPAVGMVRAEMVGHRGPQGEDLAVAVAEAILVMTCEPVCAPEGGGVVGERIGPFEQRGQRVDRPNPTVVEDLRALPCHRVGQWVCRTEGVGRIVRLLEEGVHRGEVTLTAVVPGLGQQGFDSLGGRHAQEITVSMLQRLRHAPLEAMGPRSRWLAATSLTDDPIEATLLASHGATTLGEVFYAGYQGALAKLFGTTTPQALLVTETGGQHPRALTCRIANGAVSGAKQMAMRDVDLWRVVVVADEVGEHRDLRVATVSPKAAGVEVEVLPLRMLPDVPHVAVRFDAVPFEAIQPAAWDGVVKPFRGLEDAFVLFAVCVARCGEGEAWIGMAGALQELLDAPPDAPETVLRLAGLRSWMADALRSPPPGRLGDSWARDARLFDLGGTARRRRLEQSRTRWSRT